MVVYGPASATVTVLSVSHGLDAASVQNERRFFYSFIDLRFIDQIEYFDLMYSEHS